MFRTIVVLALVAAVVCPPPTGDVTTNTNVVNGGSAGAIPVAVSSFPVTSSAAAVAAANGACGTGDLSGIAFQGHYDIYYYCACDCGSNTAYPIEAWLGFYWYTDTALGLFVAADVEVEFEAYGRVINDQYSSVELIVVSAYSYYINGEYYSLYTQKNDVCVEGLHFQQSSDHDFAFAVNGEWVNIGTYKDIQENAIDYCEKFSNECSFCNKRSARGEGNLDDRPTLDEEVDRVKAAIASNMNTTEVVARMKTMSHSELTRSITTLHSYVRAQKSAVRREEDLLQQLKKQLKASNRRRHSK
jgi:hypothetical protein